MANIAAKHHMEEKHSHASKVNDREVDLVHVQVPVDHFTVLPYRESRDVFDLEGRIVESIEVKKKIADGELRLERHSGTGVRGLPKKNGRGGKWTWEGQYDILEQEVGAPAALDRGDPNFEEPEPEPGQEVVEKDVLPGENVDSPDITELLLPTIEKYTTPGAEETGGQEAGAEGAPGEGKEQVGERPGEGGEEGRREGGGGEPVHPLTDTS